MNDNPNLMLNDEVNRARRADHFVDPIFLNRWSPRAFADEPISDEVLLRVFESARWAPSSFNEQPWRFIIARTPEDRARFLEFLTPSNQVWAQHAPVLILIAGKKTFSHNGAPNKVFSFDCGCAWGYLALGALQNGLVTHGMAGFDGDKAREILGLPDDFEPLAAIALGRRGDKSTLPDEVRQREAPSDRRSVEASVMEGGFGNFIVARTEKNE